MQTYYQKNRDGSLDILLYVTAEEMAMDFSAFRRIFSSFQEEKKKVALVRKVKIIIAGTVVLSIPFSFFAKVGANERYAMSYVYYGTGQAQLESVSSAEDTLSVVSPSYFNLTEEGSLSLNGISETFIKEMHGAGVRVVPFLSNHWDRNRGINALENGEALAEEIASVILRYNLDGVNVDIENVTEKQREQYTTFVRKLRQLVPAYKEVSVAVAANPWGSEKGWAGSYDYEALAEACDHLLIMAYDEHYQGGEPGAVGSLSFVEKSIQYALTKAPAEKLVLGIPFYGRIWGGIYKGYGISIQTVDKLAKLHETNVYYDTDTFSPVMQLTVKNGENGPMVGGKHLAPGTYTIHYENADSIKAKLSLVAKYNLKGSGNWSAGQETEDVWDYYQLWLNGKYFSDISNSFAKDAIMEVTADGLMQGRGEGVFAPDMTLTRAEAAAICTRLLELKNGQGTFSDVQSDHWAYSFISNAANANIITGYPDGTFRPEQPITRAEMTKLLAAMVEKTYDNDVRFSDVSENHWAEEEIAALARMGVLSGYPDGSFRPDNKITRGEAAVILKRIQDWI